MIEVLLFAALEIGTCVWYPDNGCSTVSEAIEPGLECAAVFDCPALEANPQGGLPFIALVAVDGVSMRCIAEVPSASEVRCTVAWGFSDGFESGDLSAWSSTEGGP